ncbi:MAG: alpha/beta hydrolase [Myxococcota bacterium]
MRRLRRLALWVGLPLGLLIGLLVVAASLPLPKAPAAPVGETVAYAGGIERLDLRFPCGTATCAGWLYRPAAAAPPVVVMAHGFAGTRDVALEPFALAFARRGLAAFVFDYRGFGASGGGPRQLIDPWRQLEDWAAAMAFVRGRSDLDGARLALWGSSMGGGHAIIAAARDGEVAAVVAQAPLVDTSIEGEAAAIGVGTALRLLFTAWADLIRSIVTDDALVVPAIGPPDTFAMISDQAAHDAFETLVAPGSTYRNAVAARSLLTFDEYDPSVQGAALDVPLLLIASRSDRFADIAGAEAFAASHPEARVAEIGGDHFEIYAPPHREEAARLATEFLAKELASVAP